VHNSSAFSPAISVLVSQITVRTQAQENLMMRRDYDIFEKFSDGCTLWRACVSGRYEAHRKMQELAELSENDFFLIDIQATELLPSDCNSENPSGPRTKSSAAAG
jgi:hypothetical protein